MYDRRSFWLILPWYGVISSWRCVVQIVWLFRIWQCHFVLSSMLSLLFTTLIKIQVYSLFSGCSTLFVWWTVYFSLFHIVLRILFLFRLSGIITQPRYSHICTRFVVLLRQSVEGVQVLHLWLLFGASGFVGTFVYPRLYLRGARGSWDQRWRIGSFLRRRCVCGKC